MLTSEEIIARYYVGYYNRAPDPEGFAFWVSNFEAGVSTLQIANFFADQDETRALYPYFADPDSGTPAQFITSVYQNLFNREPDAEGLEFWVTALTSGGVDTGQMIEAIIEGARTNPDLAVVQNKVASALYWEDQANNLPDFSYDAGAAQSANSALSVVTSDPASILTSQTQSNLYFATLNEDKGDPGAGLTTDGSTDDKVGIAGPEASSSGDLSISTLEAGVVLNLSAFQSDARFAGIDGSGQTVVVIDTGIDLNHPAFGPDTDGNGISDRIIFSRDFTDERDGTANDEEGHGTNVASIVASSASAFPGVAPGANIVALQALDRTGSGTSFWIEEALQWVVQHAEALNIVAVNMSLGDSSNGNFIQTDPIYGDELSALANQLGVTTIVAAGNAYAEFQVEGASSLSRDPNTIAIGAIGGTSATLDDVTFFSQRSSVIPTIFAPGAEINGAAPGGGTAASSGTSQAAPHVAGMVALAQQLAQQELGRSLSPSEIASLLIQTGDRFVDDETPDDRVINTNNTYVRADMFDLGEAILALSGAAPGGGGGGAGGGGGSTPPPAGNDIPGTISTDATVVVGTPVSSQIDFASDEDYFAVTLTPGDYEISLNGAASGGGTLSDPYLTLLNGSGAFIAQNDDGGTGLDSLIEFTVSTGGIYFINASAFGSATGTYSLEVVQTGQGNTGEIGDTISTAGRLNVGTSVTSALEFGADRDWFAIDLIAGQTYTFDLIGDTLSDPYLYLYNNSGAVVAADDDGGEGFNSSLTFTAARTGTFYLSAEAFLSSQTGTYTLLASGQNANRDDFSANPGTSGFIDAVAGQVVGSLEIAGDRDWFRVDLEAGSAYDFGLEGSGSGTSLRDPYLYLYDSQGNLVASNDDGGDGLNSLLSYSAISTQTYYLEAAAFGDASSGDYALSAVRTSGSGNAGGDVPGNPTSTVNIAPGQTIIGTIDAPGDTDWYGVNVVAGQTYQFGLTPSGANPIADPYLTLWDGQGNFITLNDDFDGLNSVIEFTAFQTGRVFIAAEVFDLSADTGTYALSLTTPFSAPPDVAGDPSTTATLSEGQIIQGITDEPGDLDWYAVDLTAGVFYQFALVRGETNPIDDPFLVLYDANGEVLAFDDDSAGDREALIQFTAITSDRAYISAEAYDLDTDSGTYMIAMDSSAATITGVSAFGDFEHFG